MTSPARCIWKVVSMVEDMVRSVTLGAEREVDTDLYQHIKRNTFCGQVMGQTLMSVMHLASKVAVSAAWYVMQRVH